MKALLLVLSLLQLISLSAQDSCQTATPTFPGECGEYPPLYPQIATECRTFQTWGGYANFSVLYSATCSDLIVTYILLSQSCDTLEQNGTGQFDSLSVDTHIVCVKVECLSPGGVREVCPFEQATLPVVFAGFSGESVEAGVVLSWATWSERDTDKFAISRNGSVIGWTPAAGNSQSWTSYRWTDLQSVTDRNQLVTIRYQLDLVDLDGRKETLGQVFVTLREKEGGPLDPEDFDRAGRRIKP